MSKWISVKDKLPEAQGYYLVSYYYSTLDTYYIDIVYFRGKTKWAKGNGRITHWMMLPDTPDKK